MAIALTCSICSYFTPYAYAAMELVDPPLQQELPERITSIFGAAVINYFGANAFERGNYFYIKDQRELSSFGIAEQKMSEEDKLALQELFTIRTIQTDLSEQLGGLSITDEVTISEDRSALPTLTKRVLLDGSQNIVGKKEVIRNIISENRGTIANLTLINRNIEFVHISRSEFVKWCFDAAVDYKNIDVLRWIFERTDVFPLRIQPNNEVIVLKIPKPTKSTRKNIKKTRTDTDTDGAKVQEYLGQILRKRRLPVENSHNSSVQLLQEQSTEYSREILNFLDSNGIFRDFISTNPEFVTALVVAFDSVVKQGNTTILKWLVSNATPLDLVPSLNSKIKRVNNIFSASLGFIKSFKKTQQEFAIEQHNALVILDWICDPSNDFFTAHESFDEKPRLTKPITQEDIDNLDAIIAQRDAELLHLHMFMLAAQLKLTAERAEAKEAEATAEGAVKRQDLVRPTKTGKPKKEPSKPTAEEQIISLTTKLNTRINVLTNKIRQLSPTADRHEYDKIMRNLNAEIVIAEKQATDLSQHIQELQGEISLDSRETNRKVEELRKQIDELNTTSLSTPEEKKEASRGKSGGRKEIEGDFTPVPDESLARKRGR